MESDRRLNRWGLTFTPAVINRLRKVAIYGQPQLSLEHQGRAKRYVVRGVESGGATEEVGYYVTFAGENGEALPWLQTIDSLAVNGPHAVVIAQVITRMCSASQERTNSALPAIVPAKWKPGTVRNSMPKNCFAARMGTLRWNSGAKTRI